ncbi:Short-chain dehydrogenase/reductase family protein [Mycena kentingensis (nom. inval.)]|nr:Short-chain dehydrogenase/reductase family protein [Mycena kentingensis (nom. inval.)]
MPQSPTWWAFDARARVYNFRLLWLSAVCWTVSSFYNIFFFRSSLVALASGAFVIIHHSFSTLQWRARGMYLAHFCLLLFECVGMFYNAVDFARGALASGGVEMTTTFTIVSSISLCLTLLLSLVFTASTIAWRKNYIFAHWSLLGGCGEVVPPYTVKAIWLNRSLHQELVRGESRIIIWIRSLTLDCVVLALLASAAYFILISPATADLYLRTVVDPVERGASLWEFNTTLFVQSGLEVINRVNQSWVDSIPAVAQSVAVDGESHCSTALVDRVYPALVAVNCNVTWGMISSVRVDIPLDGKYSAFVAVRPSDWDQTQGPSPYDVYDLSAQDPPPVLVLPGARLRAWPSWTLVSSAGAAWVSTPQIQAHAVIDVRPQGFTWNSGARYSLRGDLVGLQPDPNPPNAPDTTGILTIMNPSYMVARHLQVTQDSTVLSGLSSFGGLWTFVNGTFAMFFGANIVYFAFRRRPLSALGADFPEIYDEGGQPGTQRAGIIAFIRERLVDIGHGPRAKLTPDVEEGC